MSDKPSPETTPQRFASKVAVITGGAGGLGLAIAEAFCHEGGRVALFDANPEAVTAGLKVLKNWVFQQVANVSMFEIHTRYRRPWLEWLSALAE